MNTKQEPSTEIAVSETSEVVVSELQKQIALSNGVVEITDVEPDSFDGHCAVGAQKDGPYSFDFQTNFNRRELQHVLESIKMAGFPEGSVGIGEEATGFNDDEGYSFPVSDCYAVYFDRSVITNEMLQAYHRIENARYGI